MSNQTTKKFASVQQFQAITSILLITLSASASAQPQEAPESTVLNCRYINTIEGTSGYGKKQVWKKPAKHSALNKAEKLGASHVVWDRFTPVGTFNGIATAKAYDCN